MNDLLGDDGVARCPWGNSTPDYAAYHDEEWGVPLHGEPELYERLCLESFQSGLSWITILRKRENFRKAFRGFAPAKVARFTEADVTRLMQDASIVRNRAKIEAAVSNARAIADLDRPLDELLWSFAPKKHRRPRTLADVPAVTDESTAMAKDLKKRGFSFLGPTTCYALMQATGMVDDHLRGCFRAARAG
ncbi:DNA-3-methyladenine glycosylase I [Amycolatopsis sulphurea]|uniref:DNA-3-methyladenine glycosylase I n=1 Tax=Amycolatopsis sulphurea TaxID=76022 RepID=A0A2A9F9B0_9PSEU|nr:DNA-3-methyladenine glycosylase I [Amycolatopsis sulphurea]PFG47341.1 DNA-3-methyladenine glycosylase I [Amycolatopsis sulphurea]